jgi:hypothetical protein
LAPANGDAVMAADVRDRLHVKQGRSIARWTLGKGRDALVVFLKRHFRDSALTSLFRGRHRSAAFQEAARIDWAAANGFRVPRIAAVGEQIGRFGTAQSFLALEELTGMVALHEAIPLAAYRLPATQFSQWKRGLAAALAHLVRRLHRLNRFHKDLYLCHFFIDDRITRSVPPDWNGQLVMIDWQRLGHHPWTAFWWKLKDLAQLAYSTKVSGITPRDRLRFARHYAGESRFTWRWRWLRWLIGIRWWNYERHNHDRSLPAAA